MSLLDDVLLANQRFVTRGRLPNEGHQPRRRAAVVTCMDTRLVGLLEPALGLGRGEIVEIRVAGATLPDDEPLDGDMLRSLIGAIHLLGVRDVLVIGHHRCGLCNANIPAMLASMHALGVDPAAHAAYREGGEAGLARWLGDFADVYINVARVAATIRAHPYVPREVTVQALVIDPDTGALEVVVRA
jgi:carbonic anhydrase